MRNLTYEAYVSDPAVREQVEREVRRPEMPWRVREMWIRPFAVVLFGALAASAPGRAVCANLDQVIAADGRLALFARAVLRTGIAPMLRERGPFIVFAPSDRALVDEGSAYLLDGVLLTDSNAERLADLVRHHVVRARDEVQDRDAELRTLASVPLPVTRVGTGLVVARYAVVTDRIVADNGVVYIVDRLLWPRDPRWASGAHRVTRMQTGVVWITQERSRDDILVHAGETFRIERDGTTVISALDKQFALVKIEPAEPAAPKPSFIEGLGNFWCSLYVEPMHPLRTYL